ERSLDGAWRAAGATGLRVFRVHEQIEEVLESRARYQQAEFRRTLLQEVDGAPEFVLADVVPNDDFRTGLDDVANDRLQTRIPAALIKARRLVEQCLDFGGFHEARIHVVSPLALGPLCGRWSFEVSQRSSSCSEDGCLQSGVTFISMKG